jgi:hypothetical protein
VIRERRSRSARPVSTDERFIVDKYSKTHDGAAFEDLPEDWKCPRCRKSKDAFNPA